MTQLQSQIDAVTVYRRGALVTRSAKLRPGEGGFPAEVRLDNLPLCLLDGSLRFGVEGWGDLPVAVDAAVTLEAGTHDEALEPAVDEEFEAARLAAAKAKGRVEQLRGELAQVRSLAVSPRPEPEEGKQPGDSPTEARVALLDFRDAQARRTMDTLAAAEESARIAAEALAEAKQRRQEATSARDARANELRKTVTVRLQGGSAEAEASLVVKYVVPGAQWFPSYAVRLDEALGEARVEARAAVRQRTGEDWSGIELTLSTAAAQSWTELPELKALRIGRRQLAPRRSWRPPPSGAGALYADHDATFGPPASPPRQPARPATAEPAPEPLQEMDDESWDMDPLEAEEEPELMMDAVASSAPMPPPAPAAMQYAGAPRSGGAFFGRGAPKAKKEAPRRSRRAAQSKSVAAQSFRHEQPAEEAPDLAPEPSLLEYGALRMADGHDIGRGKLSPATARRSDAEVTARDLAESISRQARPPGCSLPEPHGGFDFALPADHPADIASDGALHGVALTAAEGPAEPRYLCVPGATQDVFRRVELDSPLTSPLLAGPVDVYIGESYLLTGTLRHTPGRGRIKLGLGVEQAIKVARNVRFEEDKAGLLGGTLELEHHVEVTLANHLDKAASIEVRDRIPVPMDKDDDDISVVEGNVEPPWEEWEPDERPLRGGRRWMVEVPAGAERVLRAAWTAKIPKGHELVGGNRREA